MSRGYSVSGPNASGSATKTMATIISATTVRPKIYQIIIGSGAVPADQAGIYTATRFTTVGTAASNPTPLPTDPGEVASIATAGITHSGEPTYTASSDLLTIPLNQRATYTWTASHGYELVAPQTANNGIGVRLLSATTALVQYAQVFFYE